MFELIDNLKMGKFLIRPRFPASVITSPYWQQLAGAVSRRQPLLRWGMSSMVCHSHHISLLYLDTEARCSFVICHSAYGFCSYTQLLHSSVLSCFAFCGHISLWYLFRNMCQVYLYFCGSTSWFELVRTGSMRIPHCEWSNAIWEVPCSFFSFFASMCCSFS